ncbi:hypothetical protein [Helcococcus massiliensis]|uniref:hypothetical protein n=1 Tax=Helcococcus massiliensis TaxID=2040290 RepID=UPI000CDE912F|nr:hypothetical protein [Helcococcus massiliensis]
MRKLLSYEFRNTRRQFLQLILILMGATFLIQGFLTGIISNFIKGDNNLSPTPTTFALTNTLGIVFTIIIIITVFAYYIKLGSILQRDIYDDQAYFTFSIPYNGYQIIGAKTIVGFVWAILMPIILGIWNLVLFFINLSIVMINGGEKEAFSKNFGYLKEAVSKMTFAGWDNILNLLFYAVLGIASTLLVILVIYSAIVSANKIGSKRNNSALWVLITLIFYFVWNYVFTLILNGDIYSFSGTILDTGFGVEIGTGFGVEISYPEGHNLITVTGKAVIQLIATLLMSGILYIYSSYMYEKKIEI